MKQPKYHIGQVIVKDNKMLRIVGAECRDDAWWYSARGEDKHEIFNVYETEVVLALVNGEWIEGENKVRPPITVTFGTGQQVSV